MGFAIVGYFDGITDAKIKNLWRQMADAKVDDYLINSANNPHFKFAMLSELDVAAADRIMKQTAESIGKIGIHFKKFGFYPSEQPFVTLDIADNDAVLRLHKTIIERFSNIGTQDANGYFTPGVWKPDIQLTTAFDKKKIACAINCLMETSLPFDGYLDRIGMIEFHPAKQLFSYALI